MLQRAEEAKQELMVQARQVAQRHVQQIQGTLRRRGTLTNVTNGRFMH